MKRGGPAKAPAPQASIGRWPGSAATVLASRMWSALVADGLIRHDGRMVTIVDEKALASLGHYCDRDGDFDHHWLRAVEDEARAAQREAQAAR